MNVPGQHSCGWNLKFSMECSTRRSQNAVEKEPRAIKKKYVKTQWESWAAGREQKRKQRQDRTEYSDIRSFSFELSSIPKRVLK